MAGLLQRCGKIVVQIATGVVLNQILAVIRVERQDALCIERVHPTWSDVEGSRLLPLILPRGLLVIRVCHLKPVAGDEQIQVDGVHGAGCPIGTIEESEVGTHIVQRAKLRRIEKSAGASGVQSKKSADAGIAAAERRRFAKSPEGAVVGTEAAE